MQEWPTIASVIMVGLAVYAAITKTAEGKANELEKKISDRAEGLEKKVEERHAQNSQVTSDIKEIRDAFVGTWQTVGIHSIILNQEGRIARMEKTLEALCRGCKYYKEDGEPPKKP